MLLLARCLVLILVSICFGCDSIVVLGRTHLQVGNRLGKVANDNSITHRFLNNLVMGMIHGVTYGFKICKLFETDLNGASKK